MDGSFRALGTRRYRLRMSPHYGWPRTTALIDILFLSMLFFTLSSKSTKISGIGVDLPDAKNLRFTHVDKYVISLSCGTTEDSVRLYFQDHPIDVRQLAETLTQLKGTAKNATVIVRADRRVPYEKVANIVSLAQSAGVSSFLALESDDELPETRFNQ